MKDITKHYSNDDITIVWKPSVCTHSTLCWKGATGLKRVFNPMERPWITPEVVQQKKLLNGWKDVLRGRCHISTMR